MGPTISCMCRNILFLMQHEKIKPLKKIDVFFWYFIQIPFSFHETQNDIHVTLQQTDKNLKPPHPSDVTLKYLLLSENSQL